MGRTARQGSDYRDEARAIRAAARAWLAGLRAARTAAPGGSAGGSPGGPVAAEPSSRGAVPAGLLASEAAGVLARDAVPGPRPEPLPDPVAEALPDAAPEPAPDAAAAAAVADHPAPDVADNPAPDAAPEPDPVLPLPQAGGDLAGLPGAGPGLVWLLQAAGIGSLADLAAADAASLRSRLGLAGELVNLAGWIAHAKAVCGREDGGPG